MTRAGDRVRSQPGGSHIGAWPLCSIAQSRSGDCHLLRICTPRAAPSLPRFFKHNKLTTFRQQLLTYGFQRMPKESCLDISFRWWHPLFRRGRPFDLPQLRRSTPSGTMGGGQRAEQQRRSGADADDCSGSDEADDGHSVAAVQVHVCFCGVRMRHRNVNPPPPPSPPIPSRAKRSHTKRIMS